MNICENIAISSLSTMKLGGPARYLSEIKTLAEIPEAYAFAKERNLPCYIFGGGSNIIGRDGGFNGLILLCSLLGMGIESPENEDGKIRLYSYSGETLDDFVKYACQLGYSGLESLSAIPGKVGAAPVQNVGAYGGDISQSLISVDAFDREDGEFKTLAATDLELGYRRSIFNHGPLVGRYFITRIVVELSRKELQPPFYNSLQRYLDENQITDYSPESIRVAVKAVRDSKLPPVEKYASCGSFFKNVYTDTAGVERAEALGVPVWEGGKIPSGWLVDHAGLRGQLLHGMRVWPQAALVLVNESATSYADLAAARAEIITKVKECYGFELEQEPMELEEA